MRKPVLIAAAVGVFAVAGVSACGTGTTTSKASDSSDSSSASVETVKEQGPTTAKVGKTIELSSDLLGEKTAASVTVANPKTYTVEPGEYGSKPEKGVYLVVDVAVVGKEGAYNANPYNFKFVAADGSVTEQAFVSNFKPALNSVDLNAGQKTNGKMAFDVPKSAITGGKIQIDGLNGDYNKPAAYWTL
jgi:hypothetical protein